MNVLKRFEFSFTVVKSIGAALVVIWATLVTGLTLQKFFAPKFEAVRREVFEQSKAYNQGMIQELRNMQFEYINADKEHKAALASLIKHQAADFPEDQLPPDLRQFIESL